MLRIALTEVCRPYEQFRSQQHCVEALAEVRSRYPEDRRPEVDEVFRCVGKKTVCVEAAACVNDLPRIDRRCDQAGDGPVRLGAGEAASRYGTGTTRLSAAPTTRERPIEVCGPGPSYAWILAAACDDGSKPFGATSEVKRARVPYTGRGGRCGSLLDLYRVRCPEAEYEVFVDMYQCGPGESMKGPPSPASPPPGP